MYVINQGALTSRGLERRKKRKDKKVLLYTRLFELKNVLQEAGKCMTL